MKMWTSLSLATATLCCLATFASGCSPIDLHQLNQCIAPVYPLLKQKTYSSFQACSVVLHFIHCSEKKRQVCADHMKRTRVLEIARDLQLKYCVTPRPEVQTSSPTTTTPAPTVHDHFSRCRDHYRNRNHQTLEEACALAENFLQCGQTVLWSNDFSLETFSLHAEILRNRAVYWKHCVSEILLQEGVGRTRCPYDVTARLTSCINITYWQPVVAGDIKTFCRIVPQFLPCLSDLANSCHDVPVLREMAHFLWNSVDLLSDQCSPLGPIPTKFDYKDYDYEDEPPTTAVPSTPKIRNLPWNRVRSKPSPTNSGRVNRLESSPTLSALKTDSWAVKSGSSDLRERHKHETEIHSSPLVSTLQTPLPVPSIKESHGGITKERDISDKHEVIKNPRREPREKTTVDEAAEDPTEVSKQKSKTNPDYHVSKELPSSTRSSGKDIPSDRNASKGRERQEKRPRLSGRRDSSDKGDGQFKTQLKKSSDRKQKQREEGSGRVKQLRKETSKPKTQAPPTSPTSSSSAISKSHTASPAFFPSHAAEIHSSTASSSNPTSLSSIKPFSPPATSPRSLSNTRSSLLLQRLTLESQTSTPLTPQGPRKVFESTSAELSASFGSYEGTSEGRSKPSKMVLMPSSVTILEKNARRPTTEIQPERFQGETTVAQSEMLSGDLGDGTTEEKADLFSFPTSLNPGYTPLFQRLTSAYAEVSLSNFRNNALQVYSRHTENHPSSFDSDIEAIEANATSSTEGDFGDKITGAKEQAEGLEFVRSALTASADVLNVPKTSEINSTHEMAAEDSPADTLAKMSLPLAPTEVVDFPESPFSPRHFHANVSYQQLLLSTRPGPSSDIFIPASPGSSDMPVSSTLPDNSHKYVPQGNDTPFSSSLSPSSGLPFPPETNTPPSLKSPLNLTSVVSSELKSQNQSAPVDPADNDQKSEDNEPLKNRMAEDKREISVSGTIENPPTPSLTLEMEKPKVNTEDPKAEQGDSNRGHSEKRHSPEARANYAVSANGSLPLDNSSTVQSGSGSKGHNNLAFIETTPLLAPLTSPAREAINEGGLVTKSHLNNPTNGDVGVSAEGCMQPWDDLSRCTTMIMAAPLFKRDDMCRSLRSYATCLTELKSACAEFSFFDSLSLTADHITSVLKSKCPSHSAADLEDEMSSKDLEEEDKVLWEEMGEKEGQEE